MDADTQRARAETFRDLHGGPPEGPLVLPNSWDAASTIVYEAMGFASVGTSSAGVAAALGVPDGEHLSREEMLAVVDRIAHSVTIPVSADVEAGYGGTPEAVAETVRATIDAGAVGVNLEDGVVEGGAVGGGADATDGPLVDVDLHRRKIRAAREAADDGGIPVVINGRTDVFWREVGDDAERVEHAVERANAYHDAGADCLFVPGVTDPADIEALVDGIDGPLNVLGGPGAPSIPELGDLGVARVSVGSGPMRATLGYLREVCEELLEAGTYGSMERGIPYGELNELLRESVERRGE